MNFKDLPSKSIHGNGVQYIAKFNNMYGASIVNHSFSYGGDKGLWELAVIKFIEDDNWRITYNTHITDDVLGHLTDEEVNNVLVEISNLT